MNRIVLAAAFALVLAVDPSGHARAQYFSCDQIDDPGVRSNCHAQQAQGQRQEGYEAEHPRQQTPRRQPALRAVAPSQDRAALHAELLQIRREGCWDMSGVRVSLDPAQRTVQQMKDARTVLVLSCLRDTLGSVGRIEARLMAEEPPRRLFTDCFDRLRAGRAPDAMPEMALTTMDRCSPLPQ